MDTQQDIPAALQSPVNAAVAWINEQESHSFELTGVLDTEAALNTPLGEPFELGLVLCDGELCTRQQIKFTPATDRYSFNSTEEAARDIPPLLDPPAGVRTSWLTDVLEKHEFVLLLFYRGLW